MTDAFGGEQTLPFPFCFRFNGKPWQTVIISAPSPELAADTAAGLVAQLNLLAPRLEFPPLFPPAAASVLGPEFWTGVPLLAVRGVPHLGWRLCGFHHRARVGDATLILKPLREIGDATPFDAALASSGLIHSGDSQIARSSSSSGHESRNCRQRHPSGSPSA